MENKFGNYLGELRKDKNITQKDLATLLNVSDKAISRWERGHSKPDLEMIYQISKFYNVPFNKLIMVRVASEHKEDKIVSSIINELSKIGTRKAKIIKTSLFISIALVLFLIAAIIFTNSYNRFKVYRVHGENEYINKIRGTYVETRLRDELVIGEIDFKNDSDINLDNVDVDIYYVKNKKEYILQSYGRIDNITLTDDQAYLKINDLSNYADNLYLRIKTELNNREHKEYIIKLQLILDFSNNKIFNRTEFKTEKLKIQKIDYSKIDIEEVLLNNGFEKNNSNILYKNINNTQLTYRNDIKIFNYNFHDKGIIYKYKYRLKDNTIEVTICDKDGIIVENYIYYIDKNNVNCNIGTCNNYKNVLKTIEENFIDLFN